MGSKRDIYIYFSLFFSSFATQQKMEMKSVIIFITILILGQSSNGHRILGLFPHPGFSHFEFFQPIMQALAEAGHEVTVVSQFPNKEPHENYKDEVLNDIGSGLLNVVSLDVSQLFIDYLLSRLYI